MNSNLKLAAKIIAVGLLSIALPYWLAAPIATGQSMTGSSPLEINPRFIPDDAAGFVVIQPPTRDRLGDWFPVEVVEAAGRQYIGFDPLTIESIILVVEKLDSKHPPAVGAVLRFREDTKLELKGVKRSEENGKIRYAELPGNMSAVEVDSRTILWGQENFLDVMFESDGGGHPLLQLAKTHPPKAFASTYLDLSANREFLLMVTKEMEKDTPAELKFILQLPELVDQLVIRQQYTDDFETDIRLIAGSPEKAIKMAEILQDALTTAQLSFLPVLQQGLDANDPVQAAIFKYAQRVSARLLQDLQPSVSNRELSITSKLPVQLTNGGVLIGLLLPAIQQSREAARRVTSLNNLRQLALAIQDYHERNGHLPLGVRDSVGRLLLSWRVELLPYLGEGDLYREFRLDERWDSEHNSTLITRMPQVFAGGGELKPGTTRFQAIAGEEQLFCGRLVNFADIIDGAGQTAMLVESNAGSVAIWTRPYDIQIDPTKPLLAVEGARSNNVFLTVMADGSCHTISCEIDPALWLGTTTFAGRDDNFFQNLKK